MKFASKRVLLRAMLFTGAIFQSHVAARAAEHVVAFQGEVISVSDDLNWFNDSIQVGAPVAGTYNFFDGGYQRSDNPPSSFYQYFFQPNFNGFPVLPVTLQIALGGHDYETGPGAFFYGIEVINDSDGLGFLPAGDGYRVQSPLPFPAHFRDLVLDPVVDPDGNFVPISGMSLRLEDPTGTAFGSTDLPMITPDLSKFASAIGTIFIADGNGEPNYAAAEFRITAVKAIPEPTSLAACGCALLAFLSMPRRRKTSANS